jgi:hypothetical protein
MFFLKRRDHACYRSCVHQQRTQNAVPVNDQTGRCRLHLLLFIIYQAAKCQQINRVIHVRYPDVTIVTVELERACV